MHAGIQFHVSGTRSSSTSGFPPKNGQAAPRTHIDRYCSYWPWSWMWTTSLGQMHDTIHNNYIFHGNTQKRTLNNNWRTHPNLFFMINGKGNPSDLKGTLYRIPYTIYFLHSLYFLRGRPLSHVFKIASFQIKNPASTSGRVFTRSPDFRHARKGWLRLHIYNVSATPCNFVPLTLAL